MNAEAIATLIRQHRFTYTSEVTLQLAVADVLAAAGATVYFEVRLTVGGRVDLMVGHVGVEVKIAGAPGEVERQCRRYLESPELYELVLVTARVGHLNIDVDGLTVVTLAANGL